MSTVFKQDMSHGHSHQFQLSDESLLLYVGRELCCLNAICGIQLRECHKWKHAGLTLTAVLEWHMGLDTVGTVCGSCYTERKKTFISSNPLVMDASRKGVEAGGTNPQSTLCQTG